MAKLDVICAGEFYNDLIFHSLPRLPKLGEALRTDNFHRSPGGGAAITALVARRLGLKTGVVTIVNKHTRPFDLEVLDRAGVDVSRVLNHPVLSTGISVSFSTAEDRSFLQYAGANRDLEDRLPRSLGAYLSRARHVHLAMIPHNMGIWLRLARTLRARGVTLSWDPGWQPSLRELRGVPAFLHTINVFFVNEDEGREWTGARRHEQVLRRLSSRVELPILKLGGKGAAAWQAAGHSGGPARKKKSGEVILVPAVPVPTRETTGAGDAFAGGFLSGYVTGTPLEGCLRMGNLAGATRATGGVRH